MLQELVSGMSDAAGIEGSVLSASAVGLFRIRRKVSIKAAVRDILESVLSDDSIIGVNGIRLHRPKRIQILMTDMRKWEFTPAFPVDAAVIGISVDVSVKSIELIRDEESGFPAVLITTASSVKPDVMLICELESAEPEVVSDVESKRLEARLLFDKHQVPAKHRQSIETAVTAAWSRNIAQSCIASEIPKQGCVVGIDQAEDVATMIVQDLIHKQVVTAGLFFWVQLGYWLVKIIAALIQDGDSRRVAGR